MDVYLFSLETTEKFDEGRAVKNLINYPLSVDKLQALMASNVSSPLSVILKFPYTYDEYDKFSGFSLDKKKSAIDHSMGYNYEAGILEYDDVIDGKAVTEVKPIDPKIELYLRKSIEYCKSNGINILLTNTPCPVIEEERYKCFNYIQTIADEYDVRFINGCLHEEEMGIDWKTDSYGDGGHMNYNGVTKYTTWLTDYIKSNYELDDHRGEDAYSVYDEAMQEFTMRVQ